MSGNNNKNKTTTQNPQTTPNNFLNALFNHPPQPLTLHDHAKEREANATAIGHLASADKTTFVESPPLLPIVQLQDPPMLQTQNDCKEVNLIDCGCGGKILVSRVTGHSFAVDGRSHQTSNESFYNYQHSTSTTGFGIGFGGISLGFTDDTAETSASRNVRSDSKQSAFQARAGIQGYYCGTCTTCGFQIQNAIGDFKATTNAMINSATNAALGRETNSVDRHVMDTNNVAIIQDTTEFRHRQEQSFSQQQQQRQPGMNLAQLNLSENEAKEAIRLQRYYDERNH